MDITVDMYRTQLLSHLQACGIPRTAWDGITEFIMVGRPMGAFLVYVFSNDLFRAVKKADELNIQRLRDYVNFLDGCAPAGCWGTVEAIQTWERRGGLIGIKAQSAPANRAQCEEAKPGS